MESTVTQKRPGLKDLLQYKHYMTLLTANVISRFGDSIDTIAYEWMVYILTGSKLLMGTLLAVNALPNILFSIFSGVLVDRISKKKAVIIGYLGRGIIVCTVALFFVTNILQPWHLFIFTFMTSTLESFASPAERSLLPFLLPKNMFLSASSLSTSATTLSQLIGFAAAGLIIAYSGIAGAIFLDGLTFFAACLFISFIRLNGSSSVKEVLTPSSYVKDLKEGFTFVRKHTLILLTIFLMAVTNFCLAPFNVLEPAFVKDILKSGPEGMSMIGMAMMGGMVAGGLISGQFGPRFKKSRLITAGIGSLGVCYALLSIPGTIYILNIPPVFLTIVICFFLGFSIPVATSPLSAYIMSNTPRELLGRTSALLGMFSLCAMPLGSMLTGIVSEYIAIPILFLAMGIIILVTAASLLLNKKFRNE